MISNINSKIEISGKAPQILQETEEILRGVYNVIKSIYNEDVAKDILEEVYKNSLKTREERVKEAKENMNKLFERIYEGRR